MKEQIQKKHTKKKESKVPKKATNKQGRTEMA